MERHLLCAAVALLVPFASAVNVVHAETSKQGAGSRQTIDPSQGGSINEDTEPTVLAGRPRLVREWVDVDPGSLAAANTNILYLNNCLPNGCVVRPGNTSSINNTWNIGSQRTLTPFDDGPAKWDQVVMCMREVFGPFNVQIVTTDPGPVNHFEIMIAGSPTDLGMSNGIGGVSPFSCQQFIPNSLVFDFSKVWNGDVEEICSTAAQEIAHSFALDHVTNPSDPLTYFGFNGRRRFVDAQVQCGSDCVGGQGPFGQTCTGGGANPQNHSCTCGNSQTQNSVATIKALFGDGTPTPPTVTIENPKTGANVVPGFPVHAKVADDQGVGNVELRVNGELVLTLSSPPYAFNAPATLGDGTHTAEVTAYDVFGAKTKTSVSVIIGKPCGKPADCPLDTDTCIGGRCVPGPGVQGGLGSVCVNSTECASGLCEGTAEGRFCVEICEPGAGQCPSDFGCLENGASGVCFPGYDDGTGGGGCSSSSGAPIGMGLGLAALLFARRRKRS